MEVEICYEFLISFFTKFKNGMRRENSKFASTRNQSDRVRGLMGNYE